MTLDWYDPLHDVDAVPCPLECGWFTDDPRGGPCSDCLAELHDTREPRRRAAQRVCDDESMDVCRPARPVATVDILGAL